MDESSPKRKQFVYFIGSSVGLTKIGLSTRPVWQRLFDIRNMSPAQVWLIGFISCEDASYEEAKLHYQYRSKRRHGEWFELSDSELAEIRTMVEPDSWIEHQNTAKPRKPRTVVRHAYIHYPDSFFK